MEGGIGFLLLVVGAVAGVFLGRFLFPVRIQASIRNGTFFSPPGDEHFGWSMSPSTGDAPEGTQPPRREETAEGGLTGLWVRIGAGNGRSGAEGSRLSQTFDCGSHRTGHFCTVSFYAVFHQIDGERARVIMNGPQGQPKILYVPDTGSSNPTRFVISLPGCGGNVTLAFDVTRGQGSHIQSTFDIHGVSSDCTLDNRTNMRTGGQLRNESGVPVPEGS